MFIQQKFVIQAFVQHLQHMYAQIYGARAHLSGHHWLRCVPLVENIADSDAAYHDMNHTIHGDIGRPEILRGKHIRTAAVTPRDWLILRFRSYATISVCTGGYVGATGWTLCLQRKR